ncbi:flagellar basal body rod protein [Jeotgalibacillus proteolyticus]|uniref:Flagellar basal body rod protein n=1 Tax=Jeotgalibacillus proteolyticus TaxID=2082395 RepID=A0A2S5G7D6_9BACL|nr:flagellar basal body rod protein [Jeotgalibacillus proteolyticus]PPA68890.1 flagellar basal body rod protein [Jeotgalibacillus proteolyticus]
MNKFWLVVIGAVAAIIALSNLGALVGLAITVAIMYYTAKWFFKTDSLVMKIIWGSIAVIAGLTAVVNVPAILGLIALYVLYVVYKNWDGKKTETKDPFQSFEKQWEELTKKSL